MKRFVYILGLIAWAGGVCRAERYVVTNAIDMVTNAYPVLHFDKHQSASLTVYSRLSSFALPLSLTSSYTVRWEWRDTRDLEVIIRTFPGMLVNGTNGLVSAQADLSTVDVGSYEAEVWTYLNGQRGHRVAWNTIVVTSGVSDATVSLTVNNITTGGVVQAVEEGASNAWNASTGTLTINTNPVASGVGGSLAATVFVYPLVTTNYGGTNYVGLVSAGGIITFPSIGGTNIIQFGGPTSHFYTVPVDKNLLIVHSWTGAGGGSAAGAGGHATLYIPVVAGEVLEFVVSEAGLNVPATNAAGVSTVRGGWPGGGLGVNRNNLSAGSGAGYSAIKRGTNYLFVGGGGGGSASGAAGGAGGGVSGADGIQSTGGLAGYGGTQSAGGVAPTSSVPLVVTNTGGSLMVGGWAGSTTNLNITGSAGGGGAGWYGGSGGLTPNVSNARGGGGGGSTWWDTNAVLFASATRGVGSSAPGQELPFYGSDTKGIGWGTCVGTNSGCGAFVILEATYP